MINYDDGYADSVQKHDSNICSLNIVQDNNNFLNIFQDQRLRVLCVCWTEDLLVNVMKINF